MGGRALPTLAYKLDRHTRSDYLDCHIYLERGAIHHSSVADSTRPMLIPSGGESSLSSLASGAVYSSIHSTLVQHLTCLTLPRKKMQPLPLVSPQKHHGRGRVYTGPRQSASGVPAWVPACLHLRPPCPHCHTWETVQ